MAPNNPLPIHGNEKTMNLNHLILTNIQSSPYFKVNLYELKTYHEVIDEIYYKVDHLEPWEKGSRKTAGQTGMCGGVRGVGAGGIVSSAYCLLYKLFTLKLTRKQLIGLITHGDSPYIRGLGFMYIRYTQPPADLWDWYGEYLEDDEELDVKAGGGHLMSIGELSRQWLVKIEWYSTLFPRIPVPVQKTIQMNLKNYDTQKAEQMPAVLAQEEEVPEEEQEAEAAPESGYGEAERISRMQGSREGEVHQEKEKGERHHRSGSYDFSREIERERERQRKEKEGGSKERDRDPRDRDRDRDRERERERPVERERERPVERERDRNRDDRYRRSRSRDRHHHESKPRERREFSPPRERREFSPARERRDKHRSRSRDRRDPREIRDRQERKRSRSRSRERKRSRSKERKRPRSEERRQERSPPEHKERKEKHKHKHKHKSKSSDKELHRSKRDREEARNGRH